MLYYQKGTSDKIFTISGIELLNSYSGSLTGMTMKFHSDKDGKETTLPITVSDSNDRYFICTFNLDNYEEGLYSCTVYYGTDIVSVERLLIYTTVNLYKE